MSEPPSLAKPLEGRERLARGAEIGDLVREARHSVIWDSLQMLCRIGTTLGFNLHAFGKENIPRSGGVLLVSNHQSNLDPILLAVQLRRKVSFLAKVELFQNRYFGWLIRELNAFPVRRGEGDIGAVREAINRLKEGRVLTLFPEGTRTRTGELGTIQPGIAMIVRRAQAPVIPAVIDGAFRAWPSGSRLPHPHPVRVLYGRPLHLSHLKANEIVATIGLTLRSMLAELRGAA